MQQQFLGAAQDGHRRLGPARHVAPPVGAHQDDSDLAAPVVQGRAADKVLPQELRVPLVEHPRRPPVGGPADVLGVDEELAQVRRTVEGRQRERRVLRHAGDELVDQFGVGVRGQGLVGLRLQLAFHDGGQRFEEQPGGKHRVLAQHQVRGEVAGLPPGTQGGGRRPCCQQDFGQYFTGGWYELHHYETNTSGAACGLMKRHALGGFRADPVPVRTRASGVRPIALRWH